MDIAVTVWHTYEDIDQSDTLVHRLVVVGV